MTRRPGYRSAFVMLAIMGALAGAPVAHAAPIRTLCKRAVMYDTPGGLAIAYLVKRDRVIVLHRARRWTRVRSLDLDAGWIRTSALCRA